MNGKFMDKDNCFQFKFKLQLSLLIGFVCVGIMTILYCSEVHISRNSIADYADYEKVYSEDDRITAWIDNVDIGKYLIIEGWALKGDSPIRTYECYVALEDGVTGQVYKLPTAMVVRNDVCSQYNLSEEYMNCGFYSKSLKKSIQLEKHDWEIILLYKHNGEQIYYHTNRFIRNGIFE